MARAYYSNHVSEFIQDDLEFILGQLAKHHQFAVDELQRNSWINQIQILKENLQQITKGYILFEYSIPRMGKRVDVILLINGLVLILEFKVGEKLFLQEDHDQVLDYALDLKNFHKESHNRPLIPILIATESQAPQIELFKFQDQVFKPIKANRLNISEVIITILKTVPEEILNPIEWLNAPYKPTPTIIEAAQALYQGHDVKEISRSDAGAINLSRTSDSVFQIIDKAKTNLKKTICFVTGVPGSGKTLAGLNIANERLKSNENEHAVFLSGNGPLVKVLREALIRDEMLRMNTRIHANERNNASRKVNAFIQNIHQFRDEALNNNNPPLEKVVIFDEAQRAWTSQQVASFMKRKRGIINFDMSEPHFLISIMDRHPDWAVIVCLVGGGQEINTGEAGITEWFSAIQSFFPDWRVFVSSNLINDEYNSKNEFLDYFLTNQYESDNRLNLNVSLRSFRSEKVSLFIKTILDNEMGKSKLLFKDIDENYPITLTRDLHKAKKWLKLQARGSERYGLLASSGGHRLRPIGINVQTSIDVVKWFLNNKRDVRSCYYLEEAATEFDIQGLELDWTAVIWDADFRYFKDHWEYKSFRGTRWNNVSNPSRRNYLKNAYRVLLTRARQGMVLVVPEGDPDDYTRKPEFYDDTYNYLMNIGLEIL